jgi:Nitrogenase molybdenum-iron protein, alpha and beta chains
MGLHRFKPLPSGRMGTLWTLATIRNTALIEFGCMGHLLYSGVSLKRAGVIDACKLFSTHIDETDIALGRTERLNQTVDNVIRHHHPAVVFLLPSAIPQVIGTDIPALGKELQAEFPGVRFLSFGEGGFDVIKHQGVTAALLLLAKELPLEVAKTAEPTFNIIGSCADMFRFQADADELVRLVKRVFKMDPLCIMTSDTTVADLEKMGGAHINLVIRREGEPAAVHLKKRFATPYLTERPYGVDGTTRWIEKIAAITGLSVNATELKEEQQVAQRCLAPALPTFRHLVRSHPEETRLSLGGHADVVKGILAYGCEELGFYQGTCWCDCPQMGNDRIPYFSESKWITALEQHQKGFLMTTGEALKWSGCNAEMQIANPDTQWRLYRQEPPFVGFRGAIHLANLWMNANTEED